MDWKGFLNPSKPKILLTILFFLLGSSFTTYMSFPTHYRSSTPPPPSWEERYVILPMSILFFAPVALLSFGPAQVAIALLGDFLLACLLYRLYRFIKETG